MTVIVQIAVRVHIPRPQSHTMVTPVKPKRVPYTYMASLGLEESARPDTADGALVSYTSNTPRDQTGNYLGIHDSSFSIGMQERE